MRDPIGVFDRIRDNLILYIKTAFRTRFPSVETEREALLRSQGVLCREPWIESLPLYATSKRASQLESSELPGLDRDAEEDFKELISCGLVGDYRLFEHQISTLRQSLSGNDVVVTAGTGSGKTEAFLMPLFAYLAAESRRWSPPGAVPENLHDWWKNETWIHSCRDARNRLVRSYRIPQRGHETRPPAVRGLILYPMNALVEDQLTRLRVALDSDEARRWFADNRQGNRIYFGRYNSQTPVPGHEFGANGRPNRKKIDALVGRLQEADEMAESVAEHMRENPDLEEVKYFFPQLDGSEMRSRWDMQDAPPDILITNYSMLSVMLMREIDQGIFDRTREWLEQEGSVFHLIVDELHLYRGTAGTEVAYLIRLLLERLGLTPTSPKLRVLASSASLDVEEPGSDLEEESLAFLREFFGADWTREQIVTGSTILPEGRPARDHLEALAFCRVTDALHSSHEERLHAVQVAVESVSSREASAGEITETGGSAFAVEGDIGSRMLNACSVEGELRAVAFGDFSERLFGPHTDAHERWCAGRGIFAARALAAEGTQSDLPKFRFHLFFRNLEGLWACTMPGCGCSNDDPEDGRPIGRLYSQNRILCDNEANQHRVLELLYCEQCGIILLGGSRMTLEDNNGWELLPTDPDIEGVPDRQTGRFLDQRTYREYAVFWPRGDLDLFRDNRGWGQPSLDRDEREQSRWSPAALNTSTGMVCREAQGNLVPEGTWVAGYIYEIPAAVDDEQQDRFPAVPAVCPCCGEDYTRSIYRRSPIRSFRTGFSRLSQILSKELFQDLPEGSRKLVCFSDSREDAASISNGIERFHYRDLVREALVDELSSHTIDRADLATDLRAHGQARSAGGLRFEARYPNEAARLRELVGRAEMAIAEDAAEVARNVLLESKRDAELALARMEEASETRIAPLRILIEHTDEWGAGVEGDFLIRRLKNIGVNPAGNHVLYQEFNVDGRFDFEWMEFFDFSTSDRCWIEGLSPQAEERKEGSLRPRVVTEVCRVLFDRLSLGFESGGLGYPCVNMGADLLRDIATNVGVEPALLINICNGCLRILGDLYRFPQQPLEYPLVDWPAWGSARARLRNYVSACAARTGVSELGLQGAIWEILVNQTGHRNLIIDPRNLWVFLAQAGHPVWVCPSCRREHLHSAGGICTGCLAQLSDLPNASCEDIYERNYYTLEASRRRTPFRLHCEELTAETDNPAERQRLFRDIVFDVEKAQVRCIDLLSVTTTLEVGVDIGPLQAVFLANMPPMRFNYQQRVGRAGRRGQAFAFVITLCRGRSHDEFYYERPDRITGDKPPVPFLSMSREGIAQRLMAKECLRRAFIAAGVRWHDFPRGSSDSHGEFGTVDRWLGDQDLQERVRHWLSHSPEVPQIAGALAPQDCEEVTPARLENYARNHLADRIEACAASPELAGSGLAERLAEGAVLPMFGMPSRVRDLYHLIRRGQLSRISRELDLAISEFAPGSTRTKDKQVFTAIGFTPALELDSQRRRLIAYADTPFASVRWMLRCEACHFTHTSDQRPPDEVCPQCGRGPGDDQPCRSFQVAVPRAFRTTLAHGDDATPDQNLLPGAASTLAQSEPSPPEMVTGTNSGLSLAFNGLVFRLNSSRGQLFSGCTGRAALAQGRNRFEIDHQWIDERFQRRRGGIHFEAVGEQEQIAIVAPKTTDVLRIRPLTVPPGIRLDPTARGAAVRAAFYSAAFLITAAGAELLDIDPEELDISNIQRVLTDNDIGVGEIVLNDHLPNGAGYVAWIQEHWPQVLRALGEIPPRASSFLETLIEDDHRRSCDSGCYRCLWRYRNMAFHGLLDWRLGLSVMQILANPDYSCGLDGDFSSPDIQDWPRLTASLRASFCQSFPHCTSQDYGQLVGFQLGQRHVILVHPLWNTDGAAGLLAEALGECPTGEECVFLDTFNILRRPSWAYGSLGG